MIYFSIFFFLKTQMSQTVEIFPHERQGLTYCQISKISRTKYQNLKVSLLVLQLVVSVQSIEARC